MEENNKIMYPLVLGFDFQVTKGEKFIIIKIMDNKGKAYNDKLERDESFHYFCGSTTQADNWISFTRQNILRSIKKGKL